MGGSMLEGSKGIPIILKLLTIGSRISIKLFSGQDTIGDGLTCTCLIGILSTNELSYAKKIIPMLNGEKIKIVVFSQYRS